LAGGVRVRDHTYFCYHWIIESANHQDSTTLSSQHRTVTKQRVYSSEIQHAILWQVSNRSTRLLGSLMTRSRDC
jgi:hypothetical protein